MIVRFWEARVVDGRLDDAVTWVREVVVPAAWAAGAYGSEVLTSPADPSTSNPARVVLLMRWAVEPTFVEPVADDAVIARSHGWNFTAA
jgi:hypothetical protein